MAGSVALLVLAVTIALASLPGSGLTAGTEGDSLARLLALSSGAAGLFGLATGLLLAGGSRTLTGLVPAVVVGLVIGGLQAICLLIPVGGVALLAPWLVLPLALPVISRSLGLLR